MDIAAFFLKVVTFLPIIAVFIASIFVFKYLKDANGTPIDAFQYTKSANVSPYILIAFCFIILMLCITCIMVAKELFQNPTIKQKSRKTKKNVKA